MRAIVAVVLAAALVNCSAAVHDRPLATLDLGDAAVVASLQNRLPPDDRAAFATYALLHWPKSKFYCGKPIGGQTGQARTVGDAIAVTRAYESALASAQKVSPPTPAMSRQRRERALVTQIDDLVRQRDDLYVRDGAQARNSAGAARIEERLAALRTALDELRSAPLAAKRAS